MMNFTHLLATLLPFLALAWQSPSAICATRNGNTLRMSSEGRKPLMGGNWKLNPTTISAATSLASNLASLVKDIDSVDTIIFPPFPLLGPVHAKISGSNVKLGAQDCFFETSGAYTGAVSTELLKELGVTYILVGHSERRTIFKEDDSTINKKVKKILKDGLKPVLCIGESKGEYEAGLNQQVCAIQLMKGLQDVSAEDVLNVAIAYEPVWAIGTGLTCPKEVAQEVHQFIRSSLAKKYGDAIANKIIIQYGGSANPANVKELMSMPDIDGCLVGGASLNAESFAKMIGFESL